MQSASQANSPQQRSSIEELKQRIASYPPDERVYELWRFWLIEQPPEAQRLSDRDDTKPQGLQLYRKQLQIEGESAGEIERKVRIIDKDGERLEIERWNRILTSNSPRINWKPNTFLVEIGGGSLCTAFARSRKRPAAVTMHGGNRQAKRAVDIKQVIR